ncbi:hypothetical protein PoB_004836100 [Plakobranchus ocellatus]|uniref:Uncharacterized protein n=1 Tax=Plakobranchus ocellatus TaxID=259542 RepID=A0AAV4BS19_9GAST|nr:hypothetical protein PoB_004836100 [Plakobranchus ocellatus]
MVEDRDPRMKYCSFSPEIFLSSWNIISRRWIFFLLKEIFKFIRSENHSPPSRTTTVGFFMFCLRLSSLGLESFSRRQSQSSGYQSDSFGGRQADSRVIFGGRHRDARVFLPAAICLKSLSGVESLWRATPAMWGRVILACYTGNV